MHRDMKSTSPPGRIGPEIDMKPASLRQRPSQSLDIKPISPRQRPSQNLDMKPISMRQRPSQNLDMKPISTQQRPSRNLEKKSTSARQQSGQNLDLQPTSPRQQTGPDREMKPISPQHQTSPNFDMESTSPQDQTSPDGDMRPTSPQQASPTVHTSTSPLDAALVFGHGNFQRRVLVCTTLSIFVSLSHSLAIMALARPVEHWCKPPEYLADTPADVWKNQAIPVEEDGAFSRCTRYEPPLETGNATENRTVVFCDAWDYNLTADGHSIVSEWNLVCGRRWLVSLQPITYLGGTVATSVTGYLGDRVGRRPVLLVALLVLLVSGSVTVFASSLSMFTVLRTLTSASSLTVMNMASVLLFEVTETTHRVVFCGFAACLSSATLPLVNFLIMAVARHWIVGQAMLMVPTSCLLLAVFVMEESPCWLLAKCDYDGTERVVLSAAKVNGLPLIEVKAKMSKIRCELLRRGSVDTDAKRSTALDFVLNSLLRGRAITIFGCWFMVLIFFYDTHLSRTLVRNTTLYMIYIIIRIPFPIAFMFALNSLSRRKVLCLTMVQMSVMLGFQAWLVQQHDKSFLIFTVVILGGIVMDTMLMAAFVYTLEIFPTVQRGLGLSLSIMIGRLGGMITPFIKEPNPKTNRVLSLAVGSVAFTLVGLAVLLLPETTEVKATNTIREAELEDRWHFPSPARKTSHRSNRSRALPSRTSNKF